MLKAIRTIKKIKQLQKEMHDFSLAFLLGQEIELFPENEIAKAKAQAMHDASHLLGDILKGKSVDEATARLKKTMAKEVEEAMQQALEATGAGITEFTVAPQVNPTEGQLPYHEWFVEFEQKPADMQRFAQVIDEALQKQNMYYYDLIQGKVLQPLKITEVPAGGFAGYMKSLGKLGGQNKIQRLANDRSVVERLVKSE